MNPIINLCYINGTKFLHPQFPVSSAVYHTFWAIFKHQIYIKNKNDKKEYQIQEVKYHKQMILIKFAGIENPEEAELLRGSYLLINRKDAKPLEEGTYYIVDLLGLEVYTDEGILLGKVDDIFNTGSNDIYVVKDELGKQVLLPGIEDVIKQVDLENRRITVHIIPGLM